MALPIIGAAASLGRVGYASALGGLAKDAVIGAGKGFLGGLKGAMMSEAPGLTGAYAFGKELRKRANSPSDNKAPSSGGSSNQSSNSAMGGGLTAGISTVAGQQKQGNVINLEQVRQLRQLNNNVINQSKLIALQVNEAKRKELFAEELANEQALRDDKMLEAIRNISGNGRGGRGGEGKGEGEVSASSFVSGSIFKRILTTVISAVAKNPYVAGGLAVAGGVAAAVANSGPQKPSTSSSVTGRDAENDKGGAGKREAAKQAVLRTIPRPPDYVAPVTKMGDKEFTENRPAMLADGRRKREEEQKQWDFMNAKTHHVTGLPKNTIIMKPPVLGTVTSGHGLRKDPVSGKENIQHDGIDFGVPMGTPVTPIAPGKVIAQTTSGDAGTYVSIQHDDGKVSEYMHLQEALVKVNQQVYEDTVIGKSGGAKGDKGAGKSTGAHLHLQVRDSVGGKFIDPASLPGLMHLVVGATVNPTDSKPALQGPVSQGANDNDREKRAKERRLAAYRSGGSSGGEDVTVIKNYDGMPSILKKASETVTSAVGTKGIITDSASATIKAEILKSLSGKNLKELIVLKNQIEYPFVSNGMRYMNLIPSDKSEVLKVIDEEIKKKTVVLKSDALGGQLSEAQIAAIMPNNLKNAFTLANGKQYASLNIDTMSDAGGGGGNDDSPYSLSRSMSGDGTGLKYKKLELAVHDKKLFDQQKDQKGVGTAATKQLASNVKFLGNALNTTVLPKFKPEFKSNSEIIEDANKTFLKELRSTLTGIFNTGLTEALLPNGPGVSASQAGRDDMYRGQQLKQINDTSKKINEGAVKLFGDKFGPMFAPMLDRMSTSYFEVGSRMVGKAIFQGIGDLDAKDTMTLTGQVLGNYASGKKELALEQLLYGASGGKNGGIALGTETLFNKYGFKDSMEGISYFANALGEKATQPFAKVFGTDDRSKSIIFEPRSGKYVNVDTGQFATQSEIDAANKGYGSRVSQTPLFDPSINNLGVPGAPYQTTAGQYGNVTGGITNDMLPASMGGPTRGGGSAFRLVRDAETGKMVAPSTPQLFNLSPEKYAANKSEYDQLADIQKELAKQEADRTAKIGADAIKSAAERQAVQLESEGKNAEAAKVTAEAAVAANDYVTKYGSQRIETAIREASGTGKSGSNPTGLEKKGMVPGDGRQRGQLFDANVYKDGKIDGKDPFKEIGNFGFDMLKNAAGQELTKDMGNPYMKMIANFAIQKGLNYGVEAIMKSFSAPAADAIVSTATSGGGFIDTIVDLGKTAWNYVFGGATGGFVTGPGSGTSDSIPARLSNGEFVINAAATKENMALLTAINESGLTTGKPQGFKDGTTPAKGKASSGTLSDKLSEFLSSIGVTGEGLAAYEAKQSSQVVSSSGVYNGFSMTRGTDGTMVVDKPGYYDAGKSISAFGKSVHAFGGPLAGFIPGQGILGGVAQLIGSLMTAPFDRQQDFYSDMESGKLGGAMSIGNGNYAMMDGTVKDATGTTIGGTVVDGSGRAVTTGSGGTLSFGVGPSFAAQIASNMSSISEGSGSAPAGGERGGEHLASGGPVAGPGSARSDSIPAMLSNGEFVVNALATKKYRPLLDAINASDVKYLEGGTASGSGEQNAANLAKVLGTSETNSQLAISNETLTSIDGSLRKISGQGSGSGTSVSGPGFSSMSGTGMSFDVGLGPRSGGGNVSSAGGGGSKAGPSTMDIIGNVAANVAKGYLIKAGITAVTGGMMGSLGAVLPSMYGAYSFAGGGMAGVAAAAETGVALTSMAVAEGAAALGGILESGLAFLTTNPVGWLILGGAALYAIYGGGGGGRSSPPPKNPKYHAAIYTTGNNNIDAIAPILETTDYHTPPEAYKTIAYGLLRVAFNATKASEQVTKIIPGSYDFIYMKVQYDKISMIVGKGAPNSTYHQDGAADTLSWPAPAESTNLSALAQDIINWVRDDYKKLAKAENLSKLDKAAEGLGTYTLNELSGGLIADLKSGQFKLDKSKEKGIYANSVAESNRISSLINAASSNRAYITDSEGNPIVSDTIPVGGTNMVYSMKQKKFVKNPFGLDTILLDAQDRPVYNIEGTSAGLTIDDFVSAATAGNRLANVIDNTASSGGATSNVVVGPTTTKVDNSAVTNYYTPVNGVIDIIRGTASNVT